MHHWSCMHTSDVCTQCIPYHDRKTSPQKGPSTVTLLPHADACQNSPAGVQAAITVAASDITDTRWTWSNFGSCVDVIAPGVNVVSITDTSDTVMNFLATGTSQACPHVSGVAALYLQSNPTAPPSQVRNPSLSRPHQCGCQAGLHCTCRANNPGAPPSQVRNPS